MSRTKVKLGFVLGLAALAACAGPEGAGRNAFATADASPSSRGPELEAGAGDDLTSPRDAGTAGDTPGSDGAVAAVDGETGDAPDAGDAGDAPHSDGGAEQADAGPLSEATDPRTLIGHAPARPPTACETRLATTSAPALCASCACGRCGDAASACAAAGDRCLAAFACALKNDCVGLACYCGSGVNQALCVVSPNGPCRAEYEAAAGGSGLFAVQAAAGGSSQLGRASTLLACTVEDGGSCQGPCMRPDAPCSFEDPSCQDRVCKFDAAREQARLLSASDPAEPAIERILRGKQVVWRAGDEGVPVFAAGELVTLEGSGFGRGVDIDFTKVMIGNSRVLETDLTMYDQQLDIATQVHHELPTAHSHWDSDVASYSPARIQIRVPVHAAGGALRVQVQKRIGYASSLIRPGEPHLVVNALTERIIDPSFVHSCDVVSELDAPRVSNALEIAVDNPRLGALIEQGRKIFWAYDYNIGTAHAVRGLDWSKIFAGQTTDPIRNITADAGELFGAYPTVRGEVPDAAIDDVYFDPYPQASPIPGFLVITEQRKRGNTRNSGFVGYRYAESNHPISGPGEWVGFNCASCHGYRISYERAPGDQVTRVVPGLPNPRWTMKWTLLGDFKGVVDDEPGPLWDPETKPVDKTTLLYAMPAGAGEHNVVRLRGEGSHTDNDYQFSPIAIPSVTHYMPIRRSLSHTESYVGFEGSYIHSEEPDGALGSMRADDLKALTAYMTTLDEHDDELRDVGLYRTLKHRGLLTELVGDLEEGAFVRSGHAAYAALEERIASGSRSFASACGSCHVDGFAAHTDERMLRLDQVGRFFAPTIYQKHVQSIRVGFLRDLYWVQHRGLLSDGHVRNLEDLVDPARCDATSTLYRRYYTLHAPEDPGPAGPDAPLPSPLASPRGDVFRVLKAASTGPGDAGAERNRFVLRHRYFVEVPWDTEHYYWDYQKMRAEYGPWELGTAAPIGLPAAPHPWCAKSTAEVTDLLLYLLTL